MSDKRDCYCKDRKKHPDDFIGIPEGFCGNCEICGNPGHTSAHPYLPLTGTWCNECWDDILSAGSQAFISPAHKILIISGAVAALVIALIAWFL